MKTLDDVVIGVIGLGYVGLPLAVEFGKKFATVGYDADPTRVAELKDGHDRTEEVGSEALQSAIHLTLSDQAADLDACNTLIVAVPTPIDEFKRPDFTPLVAASEAVGRFLKEGDVVVYESTVYPGATEEICVPILERQSGLSFNVDFFVGYSPERMNPGDKMHGLTAVTKVTSGSTPECADFVDALYGAVVEAGTHKATSIQVAEAAKVIENIQRDVNIALVNELALIFNRMGLDTLEVIEAASTKWNFLPFKPGLVGGHCIGVDPYYLTYKAQAIGYHPEVILAGRRINDQMGSYVADRVVRMMMSRPNGVMSSKVLILGLTFKENCADTRNTRVIDIAASLKGYGLDVDVHDPRVRPSDVPPEYEIVLRPVLDGPADYDAVVLAVGHREFADMGAERIRAFGRPGAIFYDLKGVFAPSESDGRL